MTKSTERYTIIHKLLLFFLYFIFLLSFYVIITYYTNSGGTGTRNPIFGCLESTEKWVEGKSNKAFLHFLPNLMIFQSGVHQKCCGNLKNHQKLAKNEEKLVVNNFSANSRYPKIGFRVPVPTVLWERRRRRASSA